MIAIKERENPQNSEPQNGPMSGLDYIALVFAEVQGKVKFESPRTQRVWGLSDFASRGQ